MICKTTFSEIINPKTKIQAETAIKQVFWIFILMIFSSAFKAATSLWIVFQTGIDEIGQIPGTSLSSFSDIIVALAIDMIILIVAVIFFRWKKSFIAAFVILALAAWRLINVMMAYFVYDVTSLKITTVLLTIIYVAAAIIGVLATYRLKSLNSQGV
ncbi:hypothetical protein [Rhodovulum imhoffii]|uniref:hypothetical protein n=1 Tax=Rhodovulum imhoffii TaxID=365340 RepID=UPI0011B28A81|nr:hypothetical protein [Rhodovulum imhoffii]